jgi:nicotinamide riboside kinase
LPLGDYYILLAPTVSFFQDGTRYYPSEKDRWQMYHLCVKYLEMYNVRYDIVAFTDYQERKDEVERFVLRYMDGVSEALNQIL